MSLIRFDNLDRFSFSAPPIMAIKISHVKLVHLGVSPSVVFSLAFAASIYTDVNVFTEHPVIELGHGVGPFYKTSDEAKWLVWLRSFLLREEGDSLHLAAGVPRAWLAPGRTFGVRDLASFFGPLTYRVQSGSAETTVEVEAPDRRPPQALIAHLRRPENLMIQTVTVNGKTHTDFNAEAEIVRIMAPVGKLVIRVDY